MEVIKTSNNLPVDKKIILFDGVCNLCNNAVQFIIKHDKKDVFRFIALQSDLGTTILNQLKIDITKVDSIILYEPGIAYYIKAEAALKITQSLSGFYKMLYYLNIFPTGLKSAVYEIMAKNRYKWFGKKEACMIPTPELKAKFL
jgi:predicted DCC family thiol-disulfide oxidoreductase YuxK